MANEKSVMAVIRVARPSFRNKNDKVAFAVHAFFLASGYVLIATGPPAFSDSALLSSFSTCDEEVGTDQWNELDEEYAFLYAIPENKKLVLVKCLVINHKLLVDALAQGSSSETVHLQINVDDYVGESNNNGSSNLKNLETLVKSLDTQVLCKLDTCSSSNSNKASSSITSTTTEPGGTGRIYLSWPGAGMYTARGDYGAPPPAPGFFADRFAWNGSAFM
ncbi:putative PI31 proteasome regulator [Rosa chinensis]|uniref:Putative PI31 proteasome regulator n=1 Tax=Rosa chinensis TaxID=74649 RepID=A0A2P6QXJ3_ROSCH|nr:probable proteasome inhibitor [Rosa chinensis]PRQ38917.1 putative PI31 proteasome regulator [Rosa chinensis]